MSSLSPSFPVSYCACDPCLQYVVCYFVAAVRWPSLALQWALHAHQLSLHFASRSLYVAATHLKSQFVLRIKAELLRYGRPLRSKAAD